MRNPAHSVRTHLPDRRLCVGNDIARGLDLSGRDIDDANHVVAWRAFGRDGAKGDACAIRRPLKTISRSRLGGHGLEATSIRLYHRDAISLGQGEGDPFSVGRPFWR